MAESTGGRAVFITGAAGGIGRVTVERFVAEGDRVALADLSLEAVQKVADEIRQSYPDADLLPLEVDVSSEESLKAARAAVEEWSGTLDVIALVGATVQAFGASVLELTTEEWDRVHNTNLRGVFFASRELVPLLPADSGASLVAVASYWGRSGHAFYSSYCTSKAGVISFVQCLAGELADKGIRVNAVAPGNINTGMHQAALASEAEERGISFEEMKAIEWAKIPLKVAGPPKSIADAIWFLASDNASYMTGATVDVNGGVIFV
ncbi:SDR family oxidoreductase [Cnuibacter physcomitrellae]|uniref:SDR family NAD(P)-dependent oxidoreductase n=1 Tax=Cnuibacter physcomitrellae TaxID=1619308 RepID=UPI0021756E74|nr:SDR family NAD(P)-dependent oxidoreductase [Cnuibacter physcomitrellae]MCS5497841.1 SDR family oxidoreductase [Cnuibacter physcomitrellae]